VIIRHINQSINHLFVSDHAVVHIWRHVIMIISGH